MVLPAKGKTFDPRKIRKAVKEAGFTPGDIAVTAVGTLQRKDNLLRLEMPGPVPHFVLAGGAKAEQLEKHQDLLGQRLQVKGTLHPSHADKPPGLSVEEWKLAEPE